MILDFDLHFDQTSRFIPPMDKAQTFRFQHPNGAIQEFEGMIEYGAVDESGDVKTSLTVTSQVREGSIFDSEGAD